MAKLHETRHPLAPSRRGLLTSGAIGAAALLAAPMLARRAEAQQPDTDARDDSALAPGWRRMRFGDAVVTVIADGTRPGPGPHPTFGSDQDADTVADLMQANGLPGDKTASFFNVVLVETGGSRVLIDTGFGAGGRENGMGLLSQRLRAAGIAPDQIDIVALTHCHGDHIGGLIENGAPAFPNARYAVGEAELAYWTSDEARSGQRAANAQAVADQLLPFDDSLTPLNDGDQLIPGISARAAFGHTPGMLAFEVAGGPRDLLIAADVFHHPVISFQRPDWQVQFDMDHPAAVATRRRIAARAADEGLAVMAYHLPFPGLGYVSRDGDAFIFLPDTIQNQTDAL